ncbi:MAG: DUF4150 domain-containing protein [Candidatus Omnitrophica bacterium]|nr:DUF4150 domain-containing protein [Candidatus Omnitrophota bacterium]
MGNVFANGLEISGKAMQTQTIAIFPDVCFTPPQTPATPPGIPVPYPSFGMAADTENGTKTVKIKNKMANIKNKSDEKRTTGTEAGSAPKKGIITSKNTGKKYFHSWSPNVKFEGEPVIRFSDLASHNHASPQPNGGPGPEIGGGAPGGGGDYDCDEGANKIESLLCRNKHEHGGSGDHGYLMRLAEQICGKEGPGTDSFKKHEEQLKAARKGLLNEIKAFEDAGCNLDDYEFHTKRGEKDRTDNIREAIDGIKNDNSALLPSVEKSRFLGRKNAKCKNLAEDRTDRTLNPIRGIIGF